MYYIITPLRRYTKRDGAHTGGMSETHAPLTCPACRAIDQADGVEAGNLFPVFLKRIGNARTLVDSLKRVQDRAADRITAFAGSLNFVYLHSVWFGVWVLLI